MTGFLVAAVLCAAGAVLFIALPWLRARPVTSPRLRLIPVMTALIAVVLASALYYRLSNWLWTAPPASNEQQAVASLLEDTGKNPDDVQAWLRLGNAYLQLEQFPLAQRAFEHANRTAKGGSAAAVSGIAETIVLGGDLANDARATELFERALQIDPHSAKALFYTALRAMQTGQLQLARDRFAVMLTLDAPADVHAALERQIAALDAQLKPAARASVAGTEIRLQIQLAAALQARVPTGATLFVFVRSPQGGPPLAAKRLAVRFPQEVELSAADSMIAGNSITPGQRVNVVARISATGSPIAQPGDLSGQISYVAGKDGARELVISE